MGITYQTTNRLRRKVMTAPLPPVSEAVSPKPTQATRALMTQIWRVLAALGLLALSLYAWLAR